MNSSLTCRNYFPSYFSCGVSLTFFFFFFNYSHFFQNARDNQRVWDRKEYLRCRNALGWMRRWSWFLLPHASLSDKFYSRPQSTERERERERGENNGNYYLLLPFSCCVHPDSKCPCWRRWRIAVGLLLGNLWLWMKSAWEAAPDPSLSGHIRCPSGLDLQLPADKSSEQLVTWLLAYLDSAWTPFFFKKAPFGIM